MTDSLDEPALRHIRLLAAQRSHLDAKERELGRAASSAVKVYLDVNYWTNLSDAMAGSPRHASDARLLDTLLRLRTDHGVTCVVGEDAFFELNKRRDLQKRILLARTMDQLSGGLVLQPSFDRVATELLHFMLDKGHFAGVVPTPLDHLVWRRPALVVGDPLLTWPDTVAPQDEVPLAIRSLDALWAQSFEDLVRRHGEKVPPQPDWTATASAVNTSNAAHMTEAGDFPALFQAELGGLLHRFTPTIQACMRTCLALVGGTDPSTTPSLSPEHVQQFKNLVYHAFRLKRLQQELPYLHVMAGIHAAVRMDTHRKLKPNDFHDFGHAAAALPYCDFFLTERSLKALVTTKPLAFDGLYSCVVLASTDDALSALNSQNFAQSSAHAASPHASSEEA